MEIHLPLYKKLLIFYRIEPGCLGPQGVDYVDEFCVFAKQKLKNKHRNFLRWTIKPRYDKSLPELEFQINNKKITHDKAADYLAKLNIQLDEFEEELDEELAQLVDTFFER